MEPDKNVPESLEKAYEQALTMAEPAKTDPPESSLTEIAPEPVLSSEGAVASSLVEQTFEQAQQLAQPSADPTSTVASEASGLTEQGEFVQQVVTGELSQPEGTGRGIASDLPAEFERSEAVQQATDQFAALDVDSKLAVLYYLYKGMGEEGSVTPAAPQAADLGLVQTFLDEFNALPKGEAQLEAMRALVRNDDSPLGRAYGGFGENNKLVVWYLLAQRMGKDIVDVPGDYQLGDSGKQHLDGLKELGFEQQITFLRAIASTMGRSTNLHVD